MSAAEKPLSEKNNTNGNSPQKPDERKRLVGAFVIIFCVSAALFSLNLFRLDLFQSIESRNKKPVGTVTARNNNVQRRLLDRVLWSRLTVGSPVYSGDLIRTAGNSSAALTINGDVIDINENTMVRIRLSSGGEGRVIIDLSSDQTVSDQTVNESPAIQARSEPKPKPAAASKPASPSAPASPPDLLPGEKNPPPDLPVSHGFISTAAGWKTLHDSNSMSNISIAMERIDGKEREVLTIHSTLAEGHSRWAGTALIEEDYFFRVFVPQNNSKTTGTVKTDINLIHKLINANGVRFKVLGDGEKWRVYFATTDVTDTAYHGVTIPTKKGVVSNIDISFNNLDQPDWSKLHIRFIKNNVKGITIEKNATATDNPGTSAIKVFDYEIY